MTTRAASFLLEVSAGRPTMFRWFCCECLLLAQSGHPDRLNRFPLSGVKRTLRGHGLVSAFDPKRTFAPAAIARGRTALSSGGSSVIITASAPTLRE